MKSLYKKEIAVFFTSTIGPIIIASFLLINSIILWTEISDVNLLENPYATMETFFAISPLILLIFIPALGMRTFSEEYNNGTIETILTKPVTALQIICIKFLSIITLVLVSIIPTIIYAYTIYLLGENSSSLDIGGIIGSYMGLILLSCVLISISIFCSSINSNQIIAFLSSIFLSIFMYYGFDVLSEIQIFKQITYIIKKFGIMFHYNMISKGVIIFSDLVYFVSVTLFFIKITEHVILNRQI
mgnify:CR=1 FL=1